MKAKQTMSARAIAYVHTHPGLSAAEVAAAINAKSPPAVAVALYRAAQAGKLDSDIDAGEGSRANPRRFYAPGTLTTVADNQTKAVIRRARKAGGPFGILVAQLVRPSY